MNSSWETKTKETKRAQEWNMTTAHEVTPCEGCTHGHEEQTPPGQSAAPNKWGASEIIEDRQCGGQRRVRTQFSSSFSAAESHYLKLKNQETATQKDRDKYEKQELKTT